MKFAFVSAMRSYPWGGSEELWSRAALHLRRQGHEVTVSVPWWPRLAPQVTALAENGINLIVEPPPQDRGLAYRVRRKLLHSILPQKPATPLWLVNAVDLVCISNGNYCDGLHSLQAAHRAGVPFVSIVQANAEFIWPRDSEAEKILAVYEAARQIFFVSKRNHALLETQLGVALPNAQVVGNPFNVCWDAAPPWPAESAQWRLACVARLESAAKGQDLLFQVLATDKWRARSLSVTLFGEGVTEQGLRRLASTLRITDCIRFAGQVPCIEKVWASHHALVLPSRYEGLPLALVEAMLCKRTAIVTDVGGNSEMVEDGISGFVAAAPTIQHLDDAMERAWQQRAAWRRLGEVARKCVEAKTSKDPAAEFATLLVAAAAQSDRAREV